MKAIKYWDLSDTDLIKNEILPSKDIVVYYRLQGKIIAYKEKLNKIHQLLVLNGFKARFWVNPETRKRVDFIVDYHLEGKDIEVTLYPDGNESKFYEDFLMVSDYDGKNEVHVYPINMKELVELATKRGVKFIFTAE